ncbi:MAG: hypothetical protein J5595_09480, partial [Bacteroidales bacterium]|nr:hypothetical protein [Bacteroidales bacterium]
MKKRGLILIIMMAMIMPLISSAQTDQLWLRCPHKTIESVTLYSQMPESATDKVIEAEFAAAATNFKKVKKPKDANFQIRLEPNSNLGAEGFEIKVNSNQGYTIAAETPAGALYGTYELLRMMRLYNSRPLTSKPAFQVRILNHWDNPDGSVERGYAGKSIWFKDGKINFRSDIE